MKFKQKKDNGKRKKEMKKKFILEMKENRRKYLLYLFGSLVKLPQTKVSIFFPKALKTLFAKNPARTL